MRKLYMLLILSIGLTLLFVGCVPLSFVGTSTEEVLAARQTEPTPEPEKPKETVAPQVEYIIGEEAAPLMDLSSMIKEHFLMDGVIWNWLRKKQKQVIWNGVVVALK